MYVKKYAGIGSRKTPDDVLLRMSAIAQYLAKNGWILRSGGAKGADTAFENGCDIVNGAKEIFLPHKGFNDNKSRLYKYDQRHFKMAARFHPGWQHCSDIARKMHARNCCQVLGKNLDDPVKFVICWTDEFDSGGTAQACRIANRFNIPVFYMLSRARE